MQNTSKPGPKCPICNVSGTSYCALRSHIAASHKSEMTCNLCGKYFISLRSLKIHRKKHSSESFSSCTYCSRDYQSKELLRIHVEHIHSQHKTIGDYRCHLCGKTFSDFRALFRHVKTVHCVLGKDVEKRNSSDEVLSGGRDAQFDSFFAILKEKR